MLSINIPTINKKLFFGKLEKEKERLEQLAYERELKKRLLKEFQIRFSYINNFDTNSFSKSDLLLIKKDSYDISELLYFSDLDFIKNCYRVILNREPDIVGLNNYITKLRSGKLHKIDIIGRMCLSKEARLNNTKIKGIWKKFIFRSFLKIPVLGYLIQIPIAILRLPTIIKRNEQLENHFSLLISQENEPIYEKLKLLQKNNNILIDEINLNTKMLEIGLANIISEIKSKEKKDD